MVHWLEDKVAPLRYIMFALLATVLTLLFYEDEIAHAFLVGFDIAAAVFLLSCLTLLRPFDRKRMKDYADRNDANRPFLLFIAVVVGVVVLSALSYEASTQQPDKLLIIATLIVTWLFSNTVFTLHYAFLYYVEGAVGGLDFSGDSNDPDFTDFFYFATAIGSAFATSDTKVETRQLRHVVTLHNISSLVFNVGVVSFSISVLSGN